MATQNVQSIVTLIVNNLINPLMALLIGVGLVIFMWGVVEFLWGLSTEVGDGKERGKRHMLWGVIGMAVMACAFGILAFVANTICQNGSSATNAQGISSECGF
jgi:Type IV secretion system pilin